MEDLSETLNKEIENIRKNPSEMNVAKETEIQLQEAQRALSKINPRRSTPTHIAITMAKNSDKENF